MVKQQQWLIGSVISLAISLIAVSPRLIRMENPELEFAAWSILYNFIYCFSCWLIYAFLFNRSRLADHSKYRFLIRFGIILSIAVLSIVYDFLIGKLSGRLMQFPEITGSKRPYIMLLRGSLISGLFFFIWYYLRVLSEKQKSSLEIAELKQAQLSANLSSLKEQLSPHFLFNTLNTLSSLTTEKTVKEYVAELANVYRYVLQYKELNTATLKQEIDFIASYLYIVKARMENAIDVEINPGKADLLTAIPPLTLQLLIENAIKHNVASRARQLKIQIYSDGHGYLVVRNNYQPRQSVQPSTGTGLSNVMQRYALLFNREIIIEKSELYFTVKLPII